MTKSDIARMIKDINEELNKLKISSNAEPEWRKVLSPLHVLIHWYD